MELTREQALDYVQRWKLVRARELAELRAMPASEKLRQLASLMKSARGLGWEDELREGDEEVWALWKELREKHRARIASDEPAP